MQQKEVAISDVQENASDEFLKVERRGMEPIPDGERHGSPRELALVWTGAMANYVSLLTGALVIGAPTISVVTKGQLGLLDSAIAIVIGAALAALLPRTWRLLLVPWWCLLACPDCMVSWFCNHHSIYRVSDLALVGTDLGGPCGTMARRYGYKWYYWSNCQRAALLSSRSQLFQTRGQ